MLHSRTGRRKEEVIEMYLTYQEKTVSVVADSVTPAIKMNIVAHSDYNEFPLKLIAQLYSEDHKFLTRLEQIDQTSISGISRVIPAIHNSEWGSYNQKSDHIFEMIAILSKKSIDYIEKIREKNKKKDVVFHVRATSESLISYINLGDFTQHPFPGVNQPQGVALSGNRNFSTDIRILTVPQGASLFALNKYVLQDQLITIPGSDWVNDFQELLGVGNFMIIEIPTVNLEDEHVISSSSELKTLIERVYNSRNILEKMGKYLSEGEWGKVIEESRKFMELFTKDVKASIKELVVNSTGISDDSATKLTTAFDNLEDYSNALHHSTIKNESGPAKVSNVFTGGKEDAYLIFNLCSSILNLISKKIVAYLRVTGP